MTQLLEQALRRVQALPPAERDRIARQLLAEIERGHNTVPTPHKPRTPGLAEGLIEMAEDFNDPLPDSFWLGQE